MGTKRVWGVVGIVAAGFVFTTWNALEGNEVVVLRTYAAEGEAFESRVWVVDDETGVIWIEAASDTKPFFQYLLEEPRIELHRDGRWLAFRATPVRTADAHFELRRMLAAKYGWRDRWVGRLVDTSTSIAVRLDSR